MTAMKLAGAAWAYVGASLPESAAIFQALGMQAMDLIAAPGALLDSQEIERDPQGQARRVTEAGLPLSNLLYVFGDEFDDRPLNSVDDTVRAAYRETFERVLQFCTAAGIPSVLESPFDRLAFLQRNPALKIVLDYSHFVAQGYQPVDVDPLGPYAGHVHLRQACRGKLQTRWNDGVIDFPAVVELLKRAGYSGYLALEYEHDPWMECDRVDVMTETIRMRDVVSPLLKVFTDPPAQHCFFGSSKVSELKDLLMLPVRNIALLGLRLAL